MPQPLIGITTRRLVEQKYDIPMAATPMSYTGAVSRAGGLPVLIPLDSPLDHIKPLLTRLDGLLLTGGGDIDIHSFNGEAHDEVYDVDTQRDALEFELVRQVLQTRIPLLAICRGCQVVNVALGGTLYTHISDQLDGALAHSSPPDLPWHHVAHTVSVQEGSLLASIIGLDKLEVNSLHHQGVAQVAEGLNVTARAPDGLVEALELPGHPFALAVQWHPEWMPDSLPMQHIFSAFVRAAQAG